MSCCRRRSLPRPTTGFRRTLFLSERVRRCPNLSASCTRFIHFSVRFPREFLSCAAGLFLDGRLLPRPPARQSPAQQLPRLDRLRFIWNKAEFRLIAACSFLSKNNDIEKILF